MSAFIKDILLPEKIKSYYLFTKIVVGIEINKIKIIATKTRITGTTSTIETIIEEKIPEDVTTPAVADATTEPIIDQPEGMDPTTIALTAIFSKIGNYDEVHTVLPSSVAVFKELKLPFITRDKIKMVIAFEIEPLLPFPLRDALIDFIITREIPEEKSSEVLVTAVQKQHIIQHLTMFQAAGIRADTITVDMVSLYGLYRHIDTYQNLSGGTALINITGHSTAIAFMINGQLKTVRTLPKGIVALTKQIAQELDKTSPEILDHLLRFGMEQTDDPHYSTTTQKVASDWWESVNFTLNSFTNQLLNRQPMTKIIFLGNGALIKGLVPFIAQKSGISCELFTMPETVSHPLCTVKNGNLVTPFNVISASASLPLPITVDYNLAQKEFITQDDSLLLKQLIVMIVLTISIFAALITHYYIQTSNREEIAEKSEKQAINVLTSTFKELEDVKTLDDQVMEDARNALEEKQKRWFAFSSSARASYLQYLLELSSKIDRKGIDLQVAQISISEGVLTLKGSVKSSEPDMSKRYAALKVLERELDQSALFTFAEAPPETPEFTMRLTLVSSQEPS